MVDHYKILEVDKNADDDTIRKSYKRLALKWHPDRNKDNQEKSTEKFKKISESYDILSNKEKRHQYDIFGNNDSVGIPFSTQNANDIFAQFFRDGGININQEMSFSGSSESIQTSTVIQGNKKITTRIIQKNGQVTKEVIEELITDGGNNGSVSSNNFNFTFSF
jgi:DnaJ-class molecular chaperone